MNDTPQYSGEEIFQRTELLLGGDVMSALASAGVIIFGVGGVGSWCAEGLVRSGVRRLTIVDSDVVGVSNINRQLMATVHTVGRPKVEALKDRLLDINPEAEVVALDRIYSEETAAEFDIAAYDYVIDAIDTLKNKVCLIINASDAGPVFFSSMGAALKVDPSRVRTGNFWKVRDCPLGAALRKKIRQKKRIPEHSFTCVYGDEVLENRGGRDIDGAASRHEAAVSGKAVINGTTAPVTAIFGMTLAGLVIHDIYRRTLDREEGNG